MEYVSKQDYYLAQIAAMIVAVNSKNPKAIKVQDFLLKIQKKNPSKKKLTKEERTAIAKAFWMPLMPSGKKKMNKRSAGKGK